MSSQYFGFDDDATVSTSCIQKSPRPASKPAPKKVAAAETETEKLSISQIQALLCQDLTSLDGTLDSSTNETSFYTDEQDYQTVETLSETVDEGYVQDETLQTSTMIEEKIEKRPRKALRDIENQSEINCKVTYKKPAKAAAATAKKEAKIAKPKKRKAKKENEENEENFDKFAEQINKQFAQVENFQLHVE